MIYFIAPAYLTYPILVPSLICQTSPNWHLSIIHDGHNPEFEKQMAAFNVRNDPRIEVGSTTKRIGSWGHYIRADLITSLICEPDDLIVITNHDNYCMPNLVETIERLGEDIIIWGCSHNYYNYNILWGKIEYAKIDISMVAVRARIAKEIGWRSFLKDSDFLYCQQAWAAAKTYKFLPQIMCVHN